MDTERRLVIARGSGGGRMGKMGEGYQKIQMFSNKSHANEICSMVTIVNNTVLHVSCCYKNRS